jgi:hypothetical protein
MSEGLCRERSLRTVFPRFKIWAEQKRREWFLGRLARCGPLGGGPAGAGEKKESKGQLLSRLARGGGAARGRAGVVEGCDLMLR